MYAQNYHSYDQDPEERGDDEKVITETRWVLVPSNDDDPDEMILSDEGYGTLGEARHAAYKMLNPYIPSWNIVRVDSTHVVTFVEEAG